MKVVVRVLIFATSKNLITKTKMFPYRDIPGGKHNQIHHMLIGKRWHSKIADIRSFRGADCDTGLYPVVAKDRDC
jgi:hypothetical protein